MPIQLFNRKVRVVLSKATGSFEGFSIENLRVAFDIQKTSERNANTAKITIYNLSNETWSVFDSESDRFIILEAGYEDGMEVLFAGTVTKASYSREGTEMVVSLEAGDGIKAIKTATLDKSYKKGTTNKQLVKDCVNSFKEAGKIFIGEVTGAITGKSNQGFSASGLASNIMDNVTKKLGLEYTIQNNKLIVKKANETTQDIAVVISPDTGLIDKPIKKDKGIEFKALIQPGLFPGRKVKLESDDYDDFFQVKTAKFMGDTHGGEWTCTVEAARVKK